MFEGDGNYEVLHSCENRGCFEISYYVQRHYACHNTQLINTYNQLGRDLNLIKKDSLEQQHELCHLKFMHNIWMYSDLLWD